MFNVYVRKVLRSETGVAFEDWRKYTPEPVNLQGANRLCDRIAVLYPHTETKVEASTPLHITN